MVTTEDVLSVANDLKISLTEDLIEQIISIYGEEVYAHPSSNWRFVVENIIYSILGENE